jgi:hypothetical protein
MSKKTNWFNYWDAQDMLRKLNGNGNWLGINKTYIILGGWNG